MGLAVNLSLVILATISLVCALNYFFRETGSLSNRVFMLIMGFCVFVWCMGYALMGFSPLPAFALCWRAVGLLGMNVFMVTTLILVLGLSKILPRARKPVSALFVLLGALDAAAFAVPDSVSFLRISDRTCYYGEAGAARTLHYFFLGLLFFTTLGIEIHWYRRADRKRDQRIITTLIAVNFILGISFVPDTVLPLFGVASFPGSCYGAFVCYMVIWYVSDRLNAFFISVHNLGSIIFQSVNISILVFDPDLRLAMANDFAHRFLHIPKDAHPTLSELFEISGEDTQTVYRELKEGPLPTDLRLISRADRAICSVNLNLSSDTFGDPYCTVCFVYDLTHEEEVLNEVNRMQELLQADLRDRSASALAKESSRLLNQIRLALEQEKEKNNQCDYLTGLFNRRSGEARIMSAMQRTDGALAFVDLDNLKTINDTLGHLAGDHALCMLAEVLQSHSERAIIARVGGDEFLYYMQNVSEKEARSIIEGIIHSFRSKKENDEILKVSSLSIGLCLTTPADLYSDVYQKADKALYYVKQNGKDGYYIYSYSNRHAASLTPVDLKRLVASISRQGAYQGSLGVEYREFAKFYEYIHNLVNRYDQDLQLIMLTMEPVNPDTFSLEDQEEAMTYMSTAINSSLRSVDISTRFSSEQFLIILLDAEMESVEKIAKRIFDCFRSLYRKDTLSLSYDIADLPVHNIAAGLGASG